MVKFTYNFAADSSPNPCSGQYRGVEAESEAEVQSIVEFLTASAGRFIAFLTYHSYGERILTRWDHTKQILPHDHNNLVRHVPVVRISIVHGTFNKYREVKDTFKSIQTVRLTKYKIVTSKIFFRILSGRYLTLFCLLTYVGAF